MQTYTAIIPCPFGKLGLQLEGGKLSQVSFLPRDTQPMVPSDPITKHICAEISRYFDQPTHAFSVETALHGTPFQQKVWRALQEIPPGKTLTYGELAKKLQSGPRAIGQACRKNPLPVIIPCHRIVAGNHLGGFAGAKAGELMEIKKWLLQHETNLSS